MPRAPRILLALAAAALCRAQDVADAGVLARVHWNGPSASEAHALPVPGMRGALAMARHATDELRVRLGHAAAYDEDDAPRGLGLLRLRAAGLDLSRPRSLSQTLLPDQGAAEFEAVAADGTKVEWRLWFGTDTLVVEFRSSRPLALEVAYGHWRANPAALGDDRVTVVDGALLYAHRNAGQRRARQLADAQGIDPKVLPAATAGRAYGAAVAGRGGIRWRHPRAADVLGAAGHEWTGELPAASSQLVTVTLGAAPGLDPLDLAYRSNLLLNPEVLAPVRTAAENRWEEFWRRGGIIVNARLGKSDPAHRAALAHALARFLHAANQDGELPARPAGGILPVPVADARDPDRRPRGLDFAGQSLRWVAWPHVASGDNDLLAPSLRFYRERHAVARARAARAKVEGALYPERPTLAGLSATPVGADGYPAEPSLARHHTSALEHGWVAMCARRASGRDIGPDLPWILDAVRAVESAYAAKPGKDGKPVAAARLVLRPANALGLAPGATNPADLVAALRALAPALAETDKVSEKDRTWLRALAARLPELPVGKRGETEILVPAETFPRLLNGPEIPEMHAVWPFGLAGVASPTGAELARATWAAGRTQATRDGSGSATLPLLAAMGMADEAGRAWLAKWGESATAARQPNFPGSPTDGLPDLATMGAAMAGLHAMLLAAEPAPDGRIFLLPAWPRNWDVAFRLRAPGNTQVDATVEGGKLTRLVVQPVERRDQVVLPEGLYLPPR